MELVLMACQAIAENVNLRGIASIPPLLGSRLGSVVLQCILLTVLCTPVVLYCCVVDKATLYRGGQWVWDLLAVAWPRIWVLVWLQLVKVVPDFHRLGGSNR